MFQKIIENLNSMVEKTIFVGTKIDKELAIAKNAGLISVLLRKRKIKNESKEAMNIVPDFEISSLNEIFKILDILNKK